MKSIEDYKFIDCLLVDFSVDKLVSTLSLVVEAYYSDSEHNLRKGLIKIFFSQISKVLIMKNEEFESDTNARYDEAGNDTKANEVYIVEILNTSNGSHVAKIDTDMLKMEVECLKISVTEIGNDNLLDYSQLEVD